MTAEYKQEERRENWFTSSGFWNTRKVSPSSAVMTEDRDVTSLSHEQRDLDWSFRYLFIWMRLIGIQSPPQQSSELRKRLALIFRTGIWLLIVTINIALFFTFAPDFKNLMKSTEFWNDFIEACNWFVHSIGIYSFVFIFALAKKRWVNLHESLVVNSQCTRDSQYFQPRNRMNFHKYRKLCTGGILYVLFSVRTSRRQKFKYSTLILTMLLVFNAGRK